MFTANRGKHQGLFTMCTPVHRAPGPDHRQARDSVQLCIRHPRPASVCEYSLILVSVFWVEIYTSHIYGTGKLLVKSVAG